MNNNKFLTYSVTTSFIYLKTLRILNSVVETAILEKYQEYINVANEFNKQFVNLSEEYLTYANNVLNEELLSSGIITTEYTIPLSLLTEKLFEIKLPIELTEQKLKLEPGYIQNVTDDEAAEILDINKRALVVTYNYIDFLENIFESQVNQEIFSFSYPYLIRRIIEEAKLYILVLERLVSNTQIDPTIAIAYEYTSINVAKSSAMFLRSFIDPSRNDLIMKAQSFIIEFENLLYEYKNMTFNPDNQAEISEKARKAIIRFRDFVAFIIRQLLVKEVYLNIEPIFLDVMYRSLNSINYYIFSIEIVLEQEKNY